MGSISVQGLFNVAIGNLGVLAYWDNKPGYLARNVNFYIYQT